MPYALFWHGDIKAFDYYVEAHNQKVKEDAEKRDFSAHSVGYYVLQALKAVYKLFNPFASKKNKDFDYPPRPASYKRVYTKEEIQRGDEVKEAIKAHNAEMEALVARNKEQKGGGTNG